MKQLSNVKTFCKTNIDDKFKPNHKNNYIVIYITLHVHIINSTITKQRFFLAMLRKLDLTVLCTKIPLKY